MTLPSNEQENARQGEVAYNTRRAKNEKMDTFLAIEVCILETISSGKAMSVMSVSISVISK